MNAYSISNLNKISGQYLLQKSDIGNYGNMTIDFKFTMINLVKNCRKMFKNLDCYTEVYFTQVDSPIQYEASELEFNLSLARIKIRHLI